MDPEVEASLMGLKVVFATMVTLANTKDPVKYMGMTTSWVKQLEYHGIPLYATLHFFLTIFCFLGDTFTFFK